MLLYAWYINEYISRYFYDQNDHFITIRKGVFAPQEIHIQYAKIQDVYVDQDIVDRIMGLYDVHLASATISSAMEAHIDGVEYRVAEGLKTLLLERVQGKESGGDTPGSPVSDPETITARLDEEVSSEKYPISGKWLAAALVTYTFAYLVWSFMIAFWIVSISGTSHWLLIGAGVLFALYALSALYLTVWKSIYRFEFLPDYIRMRSGVFSRSEIHLPYRTIQDVNVMQNIAERPFGLARVFVENAAAAKTASGRVAHSGITIPGLTFENAHHIADVVRKILLTKNDASTGL